MTTPAHKIEGHFEIDLQLTRGTTEYHHPVLNTSDVGLGFPSGSHPASTSQAAHLHLCAATALRRALEPRHRRREGWRLVLRQSS